MNNKRMFLFTSVIVILSMVLAACGAPATSAPAATQAPAAEATQVPAATQAPRRRQRARDHHHVARVQRT